MSYFDHVEYNPDWKTDLSSLSTLFAKTVTSEHHQHVMIMIVGAAGTGKSYAGLSLATATAEKISKILNKGTAADYYDINRNLAVINRDEVSRVMTKPKKYNVLHLDDIGVGWNARKFKDEFNIFLNDTIQTFRPNNNVVIMTLQATFLIDKVPRSLIHYLIEMEQPIFDKGLSVAKVFKVKLKHRLGKIYYEYPYNHDRYIRYVFSKPADELCQTYETTRATQLERLSQQKEQDAADKPLKKKDYIVGVVDGIHAEFGVSLAKACKIAGCSKTYYDNLKA